MGNVPCRILGRGNFGVRLKDGILPENYRVVTIHCRLKSKYYFKEGGGVITSGGGGKRYRALIVGDVG